MIKFELQGIKNFENQAAKIAKLKGDIPKQIAAIANGFGLKVWATITKKYLSGPRPDKLGVVTGLLRSSIRYKLSTSRESVDVTFGTPVPYAAIHEYGGRTSPSVILPKKGNVLAFNIGGRTVFAKKVNHPGSVIRARPFLRPGVEDNLDDLKEELNGIMGRLYGKQ